MYFKLKVHLVNYNNNLNLICNNLKMSILVNNKLY